MIRYLVILIVDPLPQDRIMFFYYDIESRLETYYECKLEEPESFDEFGKIVSVSN